MKHLRIAVATRCFAQPIRQAARLAADCRAEGIQIDARNELKPSELTETGRKQFLHHLEGMGLSVASLSFPVRRTFYDQEQLEARVAGTKAAMQFSSSLKSRVLILRIGRIPEDEASASYDILREVVNDLARYGNHIGVTPAITPMRDAAARLTAFLNSITGGPVGVNFDPLPFIGVGEEPATALRGLHQSVAHAQVRDALRDIDGSALEVPVGRGEAGWDELLALFDEAGYGGWFTVERSQGDEPATDIAHAVEYLRTVGTV